MNNIVFFFMNVEVVGLGSKRKKKNVFATAAYISGTRMRHPETGVWYDHRTKEVAHSEVMLPPGDHSWASDRQQLYTAVVAAGRHPRSQHARYMEFGLPRELPPEVNIELVRQFAREAFVSHGVVADIAVHLDNPDNPHAHLLLMTRRLSPDGFGARILSMNDRGNVSRWRRDVERTTNILLAENGYAPRFDCRSYAARGIPLLPQLKRYRAVAKPSGRRRPPQAMEVISGLAEVDEGRDIVLQEMVDFSLWIRENGETLIENPETVLKLATEQDSTFTVRGLETIIGRNTADQAQFDRVRKAVLASPLLRELGRIPGGERILTTSRVIEIHAKMAADSEKLGSRASARVNEGVLRQVLDGTTLSKEQQAALRYTVLESGDVAVVEGYAGAGKTRMVRDARSAWERAGHRVLGAAVAGKAARGLQDAAEVPSRTVTAWLYAWQRGEAQLRKGDVLVIDEAGMIGTRQMQQLLAWVTKQKAKVVLLGDTRQLQAIEAGSPMQALIRTHGSAKIRDTRRHREEWQRQATRDFGDGKPAAAVRAYADRGCLSKHETRGSAIESIVARTYAKRTEAPNQSSLMLAFRRDEVAKLNRLMRERLLGDGSLGEATEIMTSEGPKEFARGERLYFLKNDRRLGVVNGSMGTLETVHDGHLRVRLDEGTSIEFGLDRYDQLDYGYAATLHKAQGVTVDHVEVLASRHFDQHAAYVALSRHRANAHLHWHLEDFGSERNLMSALCRDNREDDRLVLEASATELSATGDASRNLELAERFLDLPFDERKREFDRLTALAEREPANPFRCLNELREVREVFEPLIQTKVALYRLEQSGKAEGAEAAFLKEARNRYERELGALRDSPKLVKRAGERALLMDRRSDQARMDLKALDAWLPVARKRRQLLDWAEAKRDDGNAVRIADERDVGATGKVTTIGKADDGDVVILQMKGGGYLAFRSHPNMRDAIGWGPVVGRRWQLTAEMVSWRPRKETQFDQSLGLSL